MKTKGYKFIQTKFRFIHACKKCGKDFRPTGQYQVVCTICNPKQPWKRRKR